MSELYILYCKYVYIYVNKKYIYIHIYIYYIYISMSCLQIIASKNKLKESRPRIDRWLHHHRALEVMVPWEIPRLEQFKQQLVCPGFHQFQVGLVMPGLDPSSNEPKKKSQDSTYRGNKKKQVKPM